MCRTERGVTIASTTGVAFREGRAQAYSGTDQPYRQRFYALTRGSVDRWQDVAKPFSTLFVGWSRLWSEVEWMFHRDGSGVAVDVLHDVGDSLTRRHRGQVEVGFVQGMGC